MIPTTTSESNFLTRSGHPLKLFDRFPLFPQVVLLLIAAVIRIYHLGYKSLWFDEAVLYWISQGSIVEVIKQNAALNSAPPLYPLLINAVSLLGSGEALLRSISLVTGILGVLAFYQFARSSVSANAAFFTSIILSAALFHVEYSQELREYSFGFLLSILLIHSYQRFIFAPDRNRTVILAAVSVISIFTQYGLVIVLLALNLHFVIELLRSSASPNLLAKWIFVQSTSVFSVVVVYFIALRFQFTNTGFAHVEQGYWRGGIEGVPSFLYRQSYDILLYFFRDPPVFLLALIIGSLVLAINRSRWLEGARLILPLVVAMVLGAAALYPYVGARQAIFLAPFLFMIMAVGFDYMLTVDSRGIIAISFIVLALRTYVLETHRYLQHPGIQNMRPMVNLLEEEMDTNDQVYVCPWGVPAFRYYYRGPEENIVGAAAGVAWRDDLGAVLRQDWKDGLEKAIDAEQPMWVVWVAQCRDKQMYVDYLNERAAADQVRVGDGSALLYVR
jgi:uncharacterized membrane protein